MDEENQQEIRIAMWCVEENVRKLYEASKKGCIQTLNTLIQADPYLIQKSLIISTNSNNNESPLLHISISHGHLEFARILLHHKPELVAGVDAFQRTPLHLASKHGDMEAVQALLEKNTSSCLVYDKNGMIPLHYAVISGQIQIMRELIDARPQSVWMKLNDGRTVLHLCVESNHLEGMKFFIETFVNSNEEFLNTMDDKGNTVLDMSIMLRQSEMVGYLLSIPEVKTRTSTIANFAASNPTKEGLDFQKKTKKRKTKRQRQRQVYASSSSFAKKATRRLKVWRENLKYKGDWAQEVQGIMMLVATVIATVTFQAGVNPPGGVWQQDTPYNSSVNYMNQYYHHHGLNLYRGLENGTIFLAGSSIMAYQKPVNYLGYFVANTVSFMASVSVMLLIISRFPLKNRVCSWLLELAMCLAVVFLTLGYLLGAQMVNSPATSGVKSKIENIGYGIAILCWYLVVVLVGLCQLIRFLIWVVNYLRTLASKP